MRIVFVLGEANLSGGVRIVAQHARLLHERGHTVTVVCYASLATPLHKRTIARLRGRRIKVRTGRSHLDNAPFEVRRISPGYPLTPSDLPEADLLLATWWETAEWIADMPAEKGIKVNFLQHYEAHPWLPADRVDAVWRMPIPKVVVSEWLANLARDKFGDTNVRLVPNGIDIEHFKFVDRRLSGKRIVGGMFSGMDRKSFKRFWLACETIEAMKRRNLPCAFVGFGARKPYPDEQLPTGARFEFAPSQERIAQIYASCDCWLFTSDKEGYGLPLLEAMACGTPVVATPAGAAPELLASGGGKLVDSDDAERLADGLEEILNLDNATWHAMSHAARAEAEKHSWNAIGDRMEHTLMQILAEGL